MEESMIQVEMPKLWIAMNEYEMWGLFVSEPHSSEDIDKAAEWFDEDSNEGIPIKVTGYTGTWQDSLHQFIDGQWRKV
jgi:hypothetical protein